MKKRSWLHIYTDGPVDAQQWDVDRAVVASGLFFLLLGAAGASLLPFLPVYLSVLGLAPLHLGLVASSRALVHIVCGPVLLRCAKRSRRRRLTMLLALACGATATLGLTAVPSAQPWSLFRGGNTTVEFANGSSLSDGATDPGITRAAFGKAIIGSTHRVSTGPAVTSFGATSQPFNATTPSVTADSPYFNISSSPSSASWSFFGGKEARLPSDGVTSGFVSPSTVPLNARPAPPDTILPTSATVEARLNHLPTTPTGSAVSPGVDEKPKASWSSTLSSNPSSTTLLPNAGNHVSSTRWGESEEEAPPMKLKSSVDDGGKDKEGTTVMVAIKNEKKIPVGDENGSRAERAISSNDLVPGELASVSPPPAMPPVARPAVAMLRPAVTLSAWRAFALVLAVSTAGAALSSPLHSLADDSLYEYLDQVDATDRYGQHELWSLLGASVAALGACALSQRVDSMLPHFYTSSALLAVALLAALAYPVHGAAAPTGPAASLRRALRRTACGPDAGALLCAPTLFVLAATGAVVDCFIFCRMRELGGSEMLMGGAVSAAAAGELLLAWLRRGGGALVRRCQRCPIDLNAGVTAALGITVFAAQALAYSLLRTPWALALVYAASGLGAPLAWHAVLRRVGLECAPGVGERTARSVAQALAVGLGAGAGAAAGGALVQEVGVERTFQGCAALLAIWAAAFGLVQARAPRPKGLSYSRLLSNESDASDSGDERTRDWLVQALEDADK
uniref:Major facilitator superfamily domain-containing protein 6-like n=1 Tax=Petromyzon marinus TaxID=7757 RepID=A0AAJ7TUG6_PETMA|nr:major facilitator superfamily domain-containing protein 6-like [Petromyzon marinus]